MKQKLLPKSSYLYYEQYIHHVKWDSGVIYEVGYIVKENGRQSKHLRTAVEKDYDAVKYTNTINIDNLYYPNEPFPDSPSFNAAFVNCIGGNNFSNIWTK